MESLHTPGRLEKVYGYPQSQVTMSYWHRRIKTPVGWVDMVADGSALRILQWENNTWDFLTGLELARGTSSVILDQTEYQLKEYFQGQRREFSIPLHLVGTDFQKQVWQELLKIPYGETISYGTQAERMGRAQAVRAVGAANGRNSIAILVPCHRVVSGSGLLTGYAGGVEIKRRLLQLEGITVKG